jgi:hypothetical protein
MKDTMALNRNSNRSTVKQAGRSSSFRQRRELGFQELEARHLLATLVVNSTADGPVDLTDSVVTLRDAVSIANDSVGADTIAFDPSVFADSDASLIRLTAGELEITDTLTIDGSTGVEVTVTGDKDGDDVTVSGSITDVAGSFGGIAGAADDLLDDNSRVLNFSSLTGDLSLESVTVTGGRTTKRGSAESGGGILFGSSGQLTLTNSTLSGNSTSGSEASGGGIYSNSGAVTLIRSTLSGNSISGSFNSGGGIRTDSGAVSLTDSVLSGNSTRGYRGPGGGIYTESGSVSLVRSMLTGNSTDRFNGSGGGIHSRSGAVSLSSSTLSGNRTFGDSARGGGIFAGSGAVTLTSSTVSGNSTYGYITNNGGGIFAGSGVSLTSSTVSGNSAGGNGGGIVAYSGAVSLTSSTVRGNSAGRTAGGIFVRDLSTDPSFTIENSIIAGNVDNLTSPIFETAPDFLPDPDSTLTINYSLIGATDLVIGGAGNQVGTLAAPIDPLLGPLTDNGGPTQTHALLPDSPAINAGNDSVNQAEDQRGLSRNVNGVDIGAFELQVDAPPIVTSFTRDEGDVLDRPDLLSTISVSFDLDVSVSADDLVIRNDTLGGSLVDTSALLFNYDGQTRTATWDFSNLTLDAAFYSFELTGDIVSVEGNVSLEGNADGTAGGSYIEPVYVAITGDANLDGKVDVLGDGFLLVENLGTSGGVTWAQGDFNGDDRADVLSDGFVLVGHLGQSVVPPSTAFATASAMSKTAGPSAFTSFERTESKQPNVVLFDVAQEEDDQVVAVVQREAIEAATPDLAGDQARDDVFASKFADADLFWA